MACKHSSDCSRPLVCIDHGCICEPLWAHTGPDCADLSWTSWALVVVLVIASVFGVTVLTSVARKNSPATPDKKTTWSGLPELWRTLIRRQPEGSDSTSTTMRAVVGTVVLEISSYVWKILTAFNVISHDTSSLWDSRVFFPLAEGCYMLPSAILIMVWVDVAKSTCSRGQSKKRMKKTRRLLQVGTTSYMLLLLLLCLSDHLDMAMVLNQVALWLGMVACGSGAAKLCEVLRANGDTNSTTEKNVLRVSTLMGICFYSIFIGNSMVLASRRRRLLK